MQVPPALGNRENRHFFIPDAQIFGDFLGHRGKRNLRCLPSFRSEALAMRSISEPISVLCSWQADRRNVPA